MKSSLKIISVEDEYPIALCSIYLAFGLTKQLDGIFSYRSAEQGSEFEIRLQP